MVGLKPGDEKDLDVTFPEDYSPELAGKAVVFKIKVHEVKEPQAPVVDDEFAKDVSEFDTLEEFRKDLAEKLRDRREHAAQAMVDFRADQVLQEYADRFERQGLPFQQYLQMTGQTLDAMKEQAKAAAEHQIKSEMALDAVAEAEKLEISEEELADEYKSLAEQYGMEAEQVKAAAPAVDVKTTLLRRKAMGVVKENVKAVKPKKAAKKSAKKDVEEEGASAEEAPKKKTASRAKKGTSKVGEAE